MYYIFVALLRFTNRNPQMTLRDFSFYGSMAPPADEHVLLHWSHWSSAVPVNFYHPATNDGEWELMNRYPSEMHSTVHLWIQFFFFFLLPLGNTSEIYYHWKIVPPWVMSLFHLIRSGSGPTVLLNMIPICETGPAGEMCNADTVTVSGRSKDFLGLHHLAERRPWCEKCAAVFFFTRQAF